MLTEGKKKGSMCSKQKCTVANKGNLSKLTVILMFLISVSLSVLGMICAQNEIDIILQNEANLVATQTKSAKVQADLLSLDVALADKVFHIDVTPNVHNDDRGSPLWHP